MRNRTIETDRRRDRAIEIERESKRKRNREIIMAKETERKRGRERQRGADTERKRHIGTVRQKKDTQRGDTDRNRDRNR